MKNLPIGEVLKQYGYISEEQLAEALAYQKKSPGKRLGTILIEQGFVTERQMLEAMALRLDMKVVDLDTMRVDTDAVEKIPMRLAQSYCMLAVGVQNGRLSVVMSDPLNLYAVEDIRQVTQMQLDISLEEKAKIEKAIDYYYAEIQAKIAAHKANVTVAAAPAAPTFDIPEDAGAGDAPVVQALNSLLLRGYSTNASDIHIEPFEDHTSVRMRVDGVIQDYVTLAPALHLPLIARIKILSNLDIAERRLPQDGHFKIVLEGTEINARVSVIPTVYGEKAVIRFLFVNATVDNSGRFGMNEENFKKFQRIMRSPNGIVYITGPTGSGKTTTLYMALESISGGTINICTIEDPVERNLARVNQMQVNNTAGLTFETGLRALLRQDPDVIMVGETRDSETASVAVRAAITGHQVFSTLHTNDAISSVVRLRDMGIPSYMIATSVVGLVAQRLMRKICPHCRKQYEATDADRAALGADVQYLYKGAGCHLCGGTGYKGRTAVHEVVIVDKEMRRMITRDAPVEEMFDYVRENQGFRTLQDVARELVSSGVSTMDEFYKISYYSD